MKSSNSSVLHPAGEAVSTVPTYGGNVRLSSTDDALTPFGGLVPWAAFQEPCGLTEALAATCRVACINPKAAPVYDVLTSFGLTVLCDGRRFVHVQRSREDPTLSELFGLERVVRMTPGGALWPACLKRVGAVRRGGGCRWPR